MISTKNLIVIVVLSIVQMAFSQRSPYAGSRPSGYKDRYINKTNSAVNNSDNDITNRFGGPGLDGTQRPPMQNVQIVYGEATNQILPTNNNERVPNPPQTRPITSNVQQQPSKIPYEAYGDIDLVNRFNDVPVDQQPFWLINQQAIEQHRNSTGNNFNTVSSRSSFLGK